ncbi:MAG: ectonucleotide pyrophosphatase/phosphodiesterase, partial [Anaerovorax sp.]
MKKLLIIVIDGCAIDYISRENTPNFYRMAKNGFCKCVKSAMPSVTNVNHATILSGEFPAQHGVVGNYYYNRDTGEAGFIEEAGYIKVDTIMDLYKKNGKSTALLTVKGKVLEVFGSGVKFGISVQKPNEILIRYLDMDMPPKVGTLEANLWILEACHNLLRKNNPDLVYCTTNDYMMHNYAPDTKEAVEQMKAMDKWIGKIYDLDTTREIYITADHGMNKKGKIVNLQHIMDREAYEVVCHPPIKDRYIENHLYQEGGVLYLYFSEQAMEKKEQIIHFLEKQEFIESIHTNKEAERKYGLPADNI